MSTVTPLRLTPSSPADLRKVALKKEMSITQTYFLAHKARAKLSREAAQPDHDLRLLVGHANLLDNLMVELADAEREQERWFNQSVRASQKTSPTEQRHVQWADRIAEEPVDDYSDSDSSEDDFDEYDDDIVMGTAEETRAMPLTRTVESAEIMDEDETEDNLEEDYAQLELVRTPSHSNSPPELIEHDSEDSSDDESMPPSPPQPAIAFAAPKSKSTPAPAKQDSTTLYKDGYYLQPQGLVSAISVY